METSTYIVFLDLSNLLSHSNFREGNLCKQSLSHNYYYFLPSTIKLIRFLKSMYHWHHNHRWVKVKVHLIKRRNFLYSHREYSPRKPTVHLSYPPPFPSILRFKGIESYFKLHWKERSRNKDVRSGDRTRDLMHQGRAPADCATLACDRSYFKAK